MEKQRWEEPERRKAEERRSEKRKSEKKEDAGARKGRKVAKPCVFQWFVAPEGRKVGLLKRRAWSHVVRWEMKSCTPLSKVSETWGFCSSFKIDGRRVTFEEDLDRCMSHGRRSTRDMFIRDVRRSGSWFPERCCILEHQIFRFAEMILRDRCSTSYDLASLFRGRRSNLDRWTEKIAKRIGTRPSALHATFHFEGSLAELHLFWCCQLEKLRKSRRIASFLTLSSSRVEEVSQNLLRFWCCQVQKTEEVSQSSFVFKLADRYRYRYRSYNR